MLHLVPNNFILGKGPENCRFCYKIATSTFLAHKLRILRPQEVGFKNSDKTKQLGTLTHQNAFPLETLLFMKTVNRRDLKWLNDEELFLSRTGPNVIGCVTA
jgi:hypothetical protein